jgi:hypothetical protein
MGDDRICLHVNARQVYLIDKLYRARREIQIFFAWLRLALPSDVLTRGVAQRLVSCREIAMPQSSRLSRDICTVVLLCCVVYDSTSIGCKFHVGLVLYPDFIK